MQSQFMVDQEDLTESTKKQYKHRLSELTEQHSVHIKSLEGKVKEFEHTVKELKSKLDCGKQITSGRTVNRFSQTEYAEDMKSTNYINVVEIDALLDALWKERYDAQMSSPLSAVMMNNTEKEAPKPSPVHSGNGENKNTQTKQTQDSQYQELTNELCGKQKQTEQALKAEQLAISSERKMLWSLIIEMVSTVIETNNVECLRLAEVLGIPWIPISPPASLECLHNMDVNSLITEHSLAEIRQFSKDLVPQCWMTVLAESVAALSVFSSEVTRLICRQRDQLARESSSLKEFRDIIQKQLQIIQEQNIQSQKNILVRQRRQFSKERTEQFPDLLSPEYINRTQSCSLSPGGSFNREILVNSRCSAQRMDQVGSDVTNALRSTIFPYKLPLVTNRYYARNRPSSTISSSILLPPGQEQKSTMIR
ncbi:hypothetical protein AHF37_10203 [Paragonimus kellicotti]|nr:hypothetical protein AHF37_10203 [Paragonimus kellicotti]